MCNNAAYSGVAVGLRGWTPFPLVFRRTYHTAYSDIFRPPSEGVTPNQNGVPPQPKFIKYPHPRRFICHTCRLYVSHIRFKAIVNTQECKIVHAKLQKISKGGGRGRSPPCTHSQHRGPRRQTWVTPPVTSYADTPNSKILLTILTAYPQNLIYWERWYRDVCTTAPVTGQNMKSCELSIVNQPQLVVLSHFGLRGAFKSRVARPKQQLICMAIVDDQTAGKDK